MSSLSTIAFSSTSQARAFTVSFFVYLFLFLSGGLRGKRETAAAALLRKVRNIVVNKVSFVFTSQEKKSLQYYDFFCYFPRRGMFVEFNFNYD